MSEERPNVLINQFPGETILFCKDFFMDIAKRSTEDDSSKPINCFKTAHTRSNTLHHMLSCQVSCNSDSQVALVYYSFINCTNWLLFKDLSNRDNFTCSLKTIIFN